jgi:asparagine synthase (glutamine-hydrolysing)
VDEHLARRYDHGNRIWLLLSAEVWYRRYISGRSEADLEVELSERIADAGGAELARSAS